MRNRAVGARKWMQVGVGLVMAGALGACAATTPDAARSPEETVTGFYEWYTAYEGSPLGGGGYRESEYLSPTFIQKVDALVASFEGSGGGYDPFICAQDRPSDISVVEVTGTADQAQVTVQAWSPILVDVALEDWEWQITDIHCTPPQVPAE